MDYEDEELVDVTLNYPFVKKTTSWSECFCHFTTYAITAFGFSSNLLALVVMLNSRRMRKTVSGVFLCTLAVTDTIILVTNLIHSLTRTTDNSSWNTHASCPSDLEIIPASKGLCSVVNYLRYTFRTVSTLVVLGIATHRFIAIKLPLKFRKFSNRRAAIIQVTSMVLASLVASLYAVNLAPGENACYPVWKRVYDVGVTVVIVIFCDIIGSLAIFTLSVCTAWTYVRAGRNLKRTDSRGNARRRDGERHMTLLLMAVAFSFVFLRMPFCVTWMWVWFKSVPAQSKVRSVRNITRCLYLTDHAINLYLYCLCSQGFRQDFRQIFKLGQRSPQNSYVRKSSTNSTSLGKCSLRSNTVAQTTV